MSLERSEDQNEASREDDFLYYLHRGSELMKDRRPEEARTALERAFQIAPENPKAQNLLGLVYFKLGLLEAAKSIYDRLVEEYPSEPPLYVNLGLVLLRQGRLNEAERALKKAIAIAPDHARAHCYLGLVLYRRGDLALAREHFLKGQADDFAKKVEHRLAQGNTMRPSQAELLRAVAENGFRDLEASANPFKQLDVAKDERVVRDEEAWEAWVGHDREKEAPSALGLDVTSLLPVWNLTPLPTTPIDPLRDTSPGEKSPWQEPTPQIGPLARSRPDSLVRAEGTPETEAQREASRTAERFFEDRLLGTVVAAERASGSQDLEDPFEDQYASIPGDFAESSPVPLRGSSGERFPDVRSNGRSEESSPTPHGVQIDEQPGVALSPAIATPPPAPQSVDSIVLPLAAAPVSLASSALPLASFAPASFSAPSLVSPSLSKLVLQSGPSSVSWAASIDAVNSARAELAFPTITPAYPIPAMRAMPKAAMPVLPPMPPVPPPVTEPMVPMGSLTLDESSDLPEEVMYGENGTSTADILAEVQAAQRERSASPTAGYHAGPGARARLVMETRAYLKASTLVAASGRMAMTPAMSQLQGKTTATPFGDPSDPMCLLEGRAVVLIRVLRMAVALRGVRDLHVVASSLMGFDDGFDWDNGKILGLDVVTLRGSGSLLLDTRGAPMLIPVDAETPVHAAIDAVLAWSDGVRPSPVEGGNGEVRLFRWRGRGYVLVSFPPESAAVLAGRERR